MSQTKPETPEELLARYGKAVLGYFVNRVRSPGDADDLYQEFALNVVRGWDKFTYGNGRSWAFKIARNLLASFLGRPKCEVTATEFPEVATEPAEDESEHDEMLKGLPGCLEKLPDDQRQAFEGRMAGFSCEELATRLGVSIQRVYALIQRAKEGLRRCLGVAVGRADE